MFIQPLPGIHNLLSLIILTFSLNLVLPKAALGYEAINITAPENSLTAGVASTEGQVQVFILMSRDNTFELNQVLSYISANDGRAIHIFPYQALFATVPAPLIPSLSNLPGVALVSTQTVELTTVESYGPRARSFTAAWNSLITPQLVTPQVNSMAEAHPEDHNDAFTAPDLPPTEETVIAAARSVTPGYYQTSEYLAGSVAVGIILVESNGSIDPSSENWTPDEKQLVFSEIMNGLNWWGQLEPRARLSFVYDDHFSNPLPTRYEPITRSYSEQQFWITEAMSALGYNTSSYFTSVRDYNNALRTTYHTNWAFTIFVVDSSVDADNRFSDGFFAYAYLGGPFMVITSENNGYGSDNLDAVTAHEMGHIFYALDQYFGAYQPCTRRSGYLNIENSNSQYGNCPSNITSIMRGQIYPYITHAVDKYAAGQVGWRDTDGDNILDPLDVELPVTIDNFVIGDRRVMASGWTEIIPYPSPVRSSITINTLTGLQYRFDQGGWQQATADDGAFDETTESYALTSPVLSPGLHTLEVTALDSLNNMSKPYPSKTFIMPDPTGGGPNTRFYPPDQSLAGQVLVVTGVAYHTQLNGVIAAVKYRVNGGPWQQAQAQDGSFNTNYEPFTLAITPSNETTCLVEAFAVDSAGNVETQFASQEIQMIQSQPMTLFLPLIVNRL